VSSPEIREVREGPELADGDGDGDGDGEDRPSPVSGQFD